MLGPALAHLYAELDGRKDKLTDYEKAIHRELSDAMKMTLFVASKLPELTEFKASGGTGRSFGGKLAGIGSNELTDVSRFNDILRTEMGLKTVVDHSVGGWDGGDRMQTACEKPDCPNKVM
jgi:hypothetical protein